MYQQHNNQITQNMLHQPQYYSKHYPQKQQHNYNHNAQFSNVSYNQSQVSKFTAHQHWNRHQQQQLSQQNEYHTAAQSLYNISQDTGTATIPSGHYQQKQQYQLSVERQHSFQQQRITPPPLDHRIRPTLINHYSLPIHQSQEQQPQITENNSDNQHSSSSQFQYPPATYSQHSTVMDQRFSTWTNTKPNTQTNVSNSVCPQQLSTGTNVQFNQYTVRPSLSVDSASNASMSSWHRPTETQQVLPPQQSVQSYSTKNSGYTTSRTSPSMPVLQNMGETEKNPPDLTKVLSYLKEPPPLVKICPNTENLSIDEKISVKKVSQQEVRRQEAPLRDLKKMYRLHKQSENSDVFRKPKEKYKPSQCSETLNSVSPKHRIASPDSTLLPDISQSKTVVSAEPSFTSDDKCETPLSPISDSDATVCYGKDDDDESLKLRCKDFDSPVRELKPASLKRCFNDGDVEYENLEKKIRMISPSRECDSTNEFVDEHVRNNCQDRLTPLAPDPVVGCVIYNDVFHVRYLLRDNNKYYLLNDIRPFLKQNKPLLTDIKPIQAYAMCTESEEKLLSWKYSRSHFSFAVTSNMKFVAFEVDPEIYCESISAKEFTDNENTVNEITDKHISAQDILYKSDLILDNTTNVVNNQINEENEKQTSALTSVTLKNELDKLSGMAQEVIHSAFSSLLEECRSLQEENQKLTEKLQFKDEKLQSYEGICCFSQLINGVLPFGLIPTGANFNL
ncbi:hypothetical protein LOTGIDRAFT_166983 [Lottia gigantea]|uniref:Uncharacterized protein n=1 Tax=Lottia gigantea TaxID=225164 RepID=V4BDJ5_LOTGI|nr:hypothetical protein LOTGIDRAFT_166983 [Lottia gigantea]ESO86709.1 hypothetical protein LOTGIDRAFT_166983 [Lottia gigantea]